MATPPHMILNPNLGRGKFIWGPYEPNRCAEAVVLAPIDAGTYPKGLPDGTLVAKITAVGATQGQYGPYDPAAADGRQLLTSLGLLYGDFPASAAAQPGTIGARDFVANLNLINFAVALNAGQVATAVAGLAAQHIIARQ